MSRNHNCLALSVALGFFAFANTAVQGAVIYSELVDGDLSDSAAAPTHLGVLAVGSSTVYGGKSSVSDLFDYLSFDIGPGQVLQNVFVTTWAPEFASFTLYANGTATPPELEFIFLPPGFGTFDLLQFDSAPGPQPAGTYSLRVGLVLLESPGFFDWTAEFVVVPIPAAGWLFAGTLGLLGWVRRQTRADHHRATVPGLR